MNWTGQGLGQVGVRGWGLCDLAVGREGTPARPMVCVVEYRGLYPDGYLAISKFWANRLFLIDEARNGIYGGLAV